MSFVSTDIWNEPYWLLGLIYTPYWEGDSINVIGVAKITFYAKQRQRIFYSKRRGDS
jgi:hypothetical protein